VLVFAEVVMAPVYRLFLAGPKIRSPGTYEKYNPVLGLSRQRITLVVFAIGF